MMSKRVLVLLRLSIHSVCTFGLGGSWKFCVDVCLLPLFAAGEIALFAGHDAAWVDDIEQA